LGTGELVIRELIDFLRGRTTAPKQPAGYRDAPAMTRRDALGDLEAHLYAKQLRIRALEYQLREQGIEPTPTPDARDLLDVADVLDCCARGEASRQSFDNLRYLAAVIRGLGTWRE
jgi:hypothetical protein